MSKKKFKISILEVLIGISFIGVGIAFLAFSKNLSKKEQPKEYVQFTKKIDPVCDSIVGSMKYSVEAGIALDISTGEIFWEYNSEKPCEIASLTKIMVELLAMEKLEARQVSLRDTVTVTPDASCIGGSQVYLKAGERFVLEDLLRAAIIYSANDAAYLAGSYIGGSKENFIKMMNDKSTELGLHHTKFWNMTGLPPAKGYENEVNMSDCIDIATISMQALKYPYVKTWMSTKLSSFRNGKFTMRTRNTLMRHCDLVDGLKTGYYPKAGWNIVATSLCGERKIMVVLLGSKSRRARDSIAKNLILYAKDKPSGLVASK
ncbi:MAG: serine hydrolase [bacterium]